MRHACNTLLWTTVLTTLLLGLPRNAAAQYSSLARVHHDGLGNSLPYRLFLPPGHDAPGAEFPLVVHLHGVGERGTDNSRQLLFIDNLIKETQTDHPAYLMVPQAAPNDYWSAFYSDGLSTSSQLTVDVVGLLGQEFGIDTSRQYLTGLSMGGFGTYDIIAKHPDLFDAAAPLSGYGDPSRAEDFLKTRIWTFHGTYDDSVSVVPDRAIIQAIRDAGGDPLYSELPAGHNIWPPIYADPTGEFYNWMFDEVRPDIVDFLYDPETGAVEIDASQAPGGAISGFEFKLDPNSDLIDPASAMSVPDTVFLDGAPVPAGDLIGAPSPTRLLLTASGGLSGVLRVPGLLPTGLDFQTLSEVTSGRAYRSPETGRSLRLFSLKTGAIAAVPEPAAVLLAACSVVLLGMRSRN